MIMLCTLDVTGFRPVIVYTFIHSHVNGVVSGDVVVLAVRGG